MYDIDHFKEVNDTYGHEVGDSVLRELTRRVQNTIRDEDAIGRWGGEEFLILVGNVSSEQATALAERIRGIVELVPFQIVGTITVSFGVTSARKDDTRKTLFARVDKALYEAKKTGRNKVVTL